MPRLVEFPPPKISFGLTEAAVILDGIWRGHSGDPAEAAIMEDLEAFLNEHGE